MIIRQRSVDVRGILLLILLMLGAVFAGLAVTLLGSLAGVYALIYLVALILVVLSLVMLFTAKEPVHRVATMALIVIR